jgi:hypothetical protein
MKMKWWVIGPLAVIVVAFITWYSLGVAADKREVEKMVSIADKVQPPATWKLNGESITSGFLCQDLSARCNSIARSYSTDITFTPDVLRKIGATAGWNLTVDKDCTPNPQSLGTEYLCKAETKTDGYFVSLTAVSRGANLPQDLSVYVAKLRDS